ncbi:MAG TPA: hypothetical protein DCM49_07550 [Lachnospiraceae bacterium]|nr:hypothetical protein [Lachnospiraceae bacterium]
MPDKKQIRQALIEKSRTIPIYQFGFIQPNDIFFDDSLRDHCRYRCEHFKTCWSCPPAIDSISNCKERCLSYSEGLFFSTILEKQPSRRLLWKDDLKNINSHEKITLDLENVLAELGLQTYIVSSDKCYICNKCNYPKEPCRYPEIMHPCLESHGIMLSSIANSLGMDYYLENGSRLMFSLLLYKTNEDMIEN